MKTWLAGALWIVLALGGCGDDDTGRVRADCDNIAKQIKAVADRDDDLKDYQGIDRTSNPCAAPVPVTSGADYRPACDNLAKCLAEAR